MATNDFVVDLVEKFKEDNLDYVVVVLQKGSDRNSSANAYYSITSSDNAELVAITLDEVFNDLAEDYDAFNPDADKIWPDIEDPTDDEEENNS